MILLKQKLDNLKYNLEKQIKEIQTLDHELTVYPNESSAKCDYESVVKKLISALLKQGMDNKL